MNDVFTARGSVLIAGVTVGGSTVDIAIDEAGVIAKVGRDAREAIDADIIIDGSDRIA
ncbi:MAG: amidohydrolase, partial [Methanomicrobiales archaeon]|nr:amidohydrolase [Methanomicrobiales archaeon]